MFSALIRAGIVILYILFRWFVHSVWLLCVLFVWSFCAVMIFLCFRVIASRCCVLAIADWNGLFGCCGVWCFLWVLGIVVFCGWAVFLFVGWRS